MLKVYTIAGYVEPANPGVYNFAAVDFTNNIPTLTSTDATRYNNLPYTLFGFSNIKPTATNSASFELYLNILSALNFSNLTTFFQGVPRHGLVIVTGNWGDGTNPAANHPYVSAAFQSYIPLPSNNVLGVSGYSTTANTYESGFRSNGYFIRGTIQILQTSSSNNGMTSTFHPDNEYAYSVTTTSSTTNYDPPNLIDNWTFASEYITNPAYMTSFNQTEMLSGEIIGQILPYTIVGGGTTVITNVLEGTGTNTTTYDAAVYLTPDIFSTALVNKPVTASYLLLVNPNPFYFIFTNMGAYSSHGTMPMVTDGVYNVINSPFNPSIVSINTGALIIGGYLSKITNYYFHDENTVIPNELGNPGSSYVNGTEAIGPTSFGGVQYKDGIFTDSTIAIGGGTYITKFTGDHILCSGCQYKTQLVPYISQAASNIIYYFNNATQTMVIAGEIPEPLFGCSTLVLPDNVTTIIFGGFNICPENKELWQGITHSNFSNHVYSITISGDVATVTTLNNTHFNHLFPALYSISDTQILIVSGSNYEVYDLVLGSIIQGTLINDARYGAYIHRIVTDGVVQYAVVGGWINSIFEDYKTSIVPVIHVGSAVDSTDSTLVAGWWKPNLEFINDPHNWFGNNALSLNLADLTYLVQPPVINWNTSVEIISGITENITPLTFTAPEYVMLDDAISFTFDSLVTSSLATLDYTPSGQALVETPITTTTLSLTTNDSLITNGNNIIDFYFNLNNNSTIYLQKQTVAIVDMSLTVDNNNPELGQTVNLTAHYNIGTGVITPGLISVPPNNVVTINVLPPGTTGDVVEYTLRVIDSTYGINVTAVADVLIGEAGTTTTSITVNGITENNTLYVTNGSTVLCSFVFDAPTYPNVIMQPDGTTVYTGVDITSTPASDTTSQYYLQLYDTTDTLVMTTDVVTVVSVATPIFQINDNITSVSDGGSGSINVNDGDSLSFQVMFDDSVYMSASVWSMSDPTNNGTPIMNNSSITIIAPTGTSTDYSITCELPGGSGVYSNTITVISSIGA